MLITGQRPAEKGENQGDVRSAEGDSEDIEIIKVVNLRPAGEIRDRPRSRNERSPRMTASENLSPYQWPPPSLERILDKVNKQREADSDQARRQLGDRWRPHYESRQKDHGSGFHRTPPTEPRAMTGYREVRHVADQSRRDAGESQIYKRRRYNSPRSDRPNHRTPSPNQRQTRLSRPQRSQGSYRLASFWSSHAGPKRARPSVADYGDPTRPLPKNTKEHSRNSGKR